MSVEKIVREKTYSLRKENNLELNFEPQSRPKKWPKEGTHERFYFTRMKSCQILLRGQMKEVNKVHNKCWFDVVLEDRDD